MVHHRQSIPLVLVITVVLASCSSSSSESEGPSTTRDRVECPASAAAPGRETATVQSGGRERSYIRYIPGSRNESKPAPLIIDLTAYSPAELEESFSSFTKPAADGTVKADEVGAVVVTPNPVNGVGLQTWNVDDTEGWTDDEQFITDLVAAVSTDTCIDRSRVFAMGFAIGAVMASTLACDRPEMLAAVATVSGLWDPPGCAPATPVPTISLHGTGDQFLPYEGGVGDRIGMLGLTPETTVGLVAMANRPGAVAASAAWAARNGCDRESTDRPVTAGVSRTTWSGCDAAVELYTIAGGSHTWPGSNGMATYEGLLGPVSTAVNANDVIWDFFTSHA